MTAEIAILNRQGVALAADSAVTIGRERVWKTTNKLFSLAPFNDIGIMAYGAGDFIGYPWETVVKTFRTHVGSRKFTTVDECATELMSYLKSSELQLHSQERISILVVFMNRLEMVKSSIGPYTSKADFRTRIKSVLRSHIEDVEKAEANSACVDQANFSAAHSSEILDLAKDTFKDHLTNDIKDLVDKLMFELQ